MTEVGRAVAAWDIDTEGLEETANVCSAHRLHGRHRIPMGRVPEPADLAKVIRFLLSDEDGYISGSSVVIDGGMTAVM